MSMCHCKTNKSRESRQISPGFRVCGVLVNDCYNLIVKQSLSNVLHSQVKTEYHKANGLHVLLNAS